MKKLLTTIVPFQTSDLIAIKVENGLVINNSLDLVSATLRFRNYLNILIPYHSISLNITANL